MAIESIQLASTSEHDCELTITVAKNLVGQELTHAVNSKQRVASRPGFRAGKMPRNMVMNMFAAEIKQMTLNKIFEKSFAAACEEKSVVPVSEPQIEPVSEIVQDQSFTYRASFQKKPTIGSVKFEGLAIEMRQFTFDESDVDDELKSLQEVMATFVEPTDREEISDQDLVQCDCVLIIDGKVEPKYSYSDYTVPMFAQNVPDELRTVLLGKKAFDIVTTSYTMPSEHQDDDIRGKECTMQLTINSFKSRVLPELNDDFAKDISEKFTCLDDIKESIRTRFNITAKRRDEYYRQDAIIKALIENNPIDPPSALVRRMATILIDRELAAMANKEAEALVKNHWREIWEGVQQRALYRVKMELLFEALIEQLNVEVNEEDIDKKVASTKNLSKDDARYTLQVEKIVSIIEKKANVTIQQENLFKKG